MTKWALLCGGKHSGKSTLATRVTDDLIRRGVLVDGVLQDAILEDGERVGYTARRLLGGERRLLAHKSQRQFSSPQQACSFCSFQFDEQTFRQARGWIEEASSRAQVVVIDEVSKLEVSRQGHHDAILEALGGSALVLLVVRADQLFSVVERFHLEEPVASLETAEPEAISSFVDAIVAAVQAP